MSMFSLPKMPEAKTFCATCLLHIIITYLAHNLFKLAKVLCFLNFSLIMSHKTYKSPRPPHPTLFPFRTNFVIISKQNLGRAIFSVLARTTMCVVFMCAMLILASSSSSGNCGSNHLPI